MRGNDVAIIGAAGVFPNAPDLEAFHANLRASRDSVRPPGENRLPDPETDPADAYLAMGYLDRIDLFDHELFGISSREADLMDPHQRLLVQLTHEAMESAGYAPSVLRGTPTAVLVSAIDPSFDPSDGDRDVLKMLGTSTAALSARLAYQFDLRGPALVVDTACSSGLTALSIAVGQLRRGDVKLAVVGGVNLFPVPIRRAGWAPLPGLESDGDQCRPFDAGATGLTGGEGGGVLLLKPLADAVADRDNIFAVLKGIAVNHNGYRASSMAAPSQLGQAAVITDAWRDAEVDGTTIGYIECHGSGTPLGDVVEVDALRKAFAGAGNHRCAISSVKANIGHLGNTAGIAGLFKIMGALRHGEHYPAANFRTPNPHIDLSGPVFVNTESRPWPRPAGHPRRAGLSSWGLTGTNVHVVLEEAPTPEPLPDAGSQAELVTVSARSAAALERYRLRLADFAERTDQPLRVVAHVLNRGRDDHPYRMAVTATTTAELAERLREPMPAAKAAADAPPLVVLFSGDVVPNDPASTDAGLLVSRQHALFRLAQSLGLTDVTLVGSGPGNLAVRVARGKLTLDAAVEAAAGEAPTAEVDESRLEPLIAGFVRDGAIVAELGAGGVLGRQVRRLAPELPIVDLVADGSRAGLLERLGELYTLGARLDWDRYFGDGPVPRIEAPTYPFEPTQCRVAHRAPGPAPAAETTRPQPAADLGDVVARVAAIWAEALDRAEAGPDADYFQLGGTSLVGVGLLRRLKREFGVDVTFTDLYANPTVRQMAERVAELAADQTGSAQEPITVIERTGPLPLSYGQEPLWYVEQINPGSAVYNVPVPLRLTGPLDENALQDALIDVAGRHEVLRSTFHSDENDSPYVAFLAPEPLLPVLNASRLAPEQQTERVRQIVRETVSSPFDIARDTPFRAVLIRLAEDDHVLVLTFHHIVFDGGSGPVFMRDLAEFYRARSTGTGAELPDLPVQYQDYAAWHRQLLAGGRSLEFWRSELEGLNRKELPLDRPRPAEQSFEGDVLPLFIEPAIAERIREFSRGAGVTTFVTMLAALDALIHLWTGGPDVVVGVATSGRIHPDMQDLVGYFNNLPPFRTRTTGDMHFSDLVRRCSATVAGVLDHEEVPVSRIITAAGLRRDPARHPLYDVTYTYQNVLPYAGGMSGLQIGRYEETEVLGVVPGTAKFDLSFGVNDAGEGPMGGELGYATALFDRSTAEDLIARFVALVAAVAEDPDRPLHELGKRPAATPAVSQTPAAAPAAAPAAPAAEEKLRLLFGEVVGAESVRATDDFFELGGDSVMAIQLVARARRAGLVINQRQVFAERTPAGLATVTVGSTAAAPGSAADTQQFPLTPVMRELAGRGGLDGSTTLSVLLVTPPGIDHITLTGAVRVVAGHHDMLRARLLTPAPDPATWSILVSPPGAAETSVELTRVDAAGLTGRSLMDAVVRETRAASERIDIRGGVTSQLIWLDRGDAEEGRLVVVAHHLVVDVLSWKVLVDDLAEAYDALDRGRPAGLRPVPTQFGEWARILADQSREAACTAELPAWRQIAAPGVATLGGRELDPARDTTANARKVSMPVPPAVTDSLLNAVPAALQLGTADVLLAALGAAVTEWRAARGEGRAPVLVDVEGNGREPLVDGMDLTRTVGWFTCTYPVRVDPGPVDFADVRTGGPAAGQIVERVREQLRAVPGNGLGYGMLRYLNPGTARELAGAPTPLILFNYLAGLAGAGPAPARDDEPAAWRMVDTTGDLGDRTPLGYALDAAASVRNGPDGPTLRLTLLASGELLPESAIRELVDGWATILAGVAAYAREIR